MKVLQINKTKDLGASLKINKRKKKRAQHFLKIFDLLVLSTFYCS